MLAQESLSCQIEVASEFRYRQSVVPPDTLFVTISQSGETADTLAALRAAKQAGYIGSLVVCNVPESSLVRESDVALMTRAGPEIGVASTKAFTTQLVALRLMTLALGKRRGITVETEKEWVEELEALPRQVEVALNLSAAIAEMAQSFSDKHNALFLGRGTFYPIALEGALKLKESRTSMPRPTRLASSSTARSRWSTSACRWSARCPTITAGKGAVEPAGSARARWRCSCSTLNGTDRPRHAEPDPRRHQSGHRADRLPRSPAVAVYRVAVLKGTDVDQPRNLAKSVTVE